jgi:hypothetical protein
MSDIMYCLSQAKTESDVTNIRNYFADTFKRVPGLNDLSKAAIKRIRAVDRVKTMYQNQN